MKLLNSIFLGISLLFTPLFAQDGPADLNTFSVGLRAAHLYDLPSYKFDNSLSQDLKGLNGDFTNIDLGIDAYLEKQFTPLLGVQAGVRFGGLTGANDVEHYQNRFLTINGDMVFLLSNLDRRRVDARFNYYAKLGLGYGTYRAERFLNADNSSNGEISDDYWETRIGAGVQYELSRNIRLEIDASYNMAHDDGFDGYNNATGSDPYLSTGIGVAYTFGNKEQKPMYSVNFFGEEYAGKIAETPVNEFEAPDKVKLQAFMDEMVAYKEHVDSVMAWQQAFFDDVASRMEAQDSVIAEQAMALADLSQAKNEMEQALAAQEKEAERKREMQELMNNPQYAATVAMLGGGAALASASNDDAKDLEKEDIFEKGTITASLEPVAEAEEEMTSLEMTAYFGFDSDQLDAEYRRELKEKVGTLKTNKITLVGFADAIGSRSYNQKLKSRRADAVRNYLISELGVPEENIEVELAPDQPDIGDDNYLNRKVVIKA